MRDVTITVTGITPYSASKPVSSTANKGEKPDEFDARTWKEKAHCDESGAVIIPGVSFKQALDEATAVINEKIKGKGNQTYGKVISTGCAAISDMAIGVHVDSLKAIKIFVNADGKRGSGTRVWRTFPFVPSWGGSVTFRIFNDDISEADFERFFEQSGLLIGVGRGRPGMKCPAGNGRYRATKFEWAEV